MSSFSDSDSSSELDSSSEDAVSVDAVEALTEVSSRAPIRIPDFGPSKAEPGLPEVSNGPIRLTEELASCDWIEWERRDADGSDRLWLVKDQSFSGAIQRVLSSSIHH